MEDVLQEVTLHHVGGGRLILEAAALAKEYRGQPALTNLQMELAPGEVHGLLGPNGSGKTTALHLLTGIVKMEAGTVRICGIPIERKESRDYIGFAPDDLSLPSMLTGFEYLSMHDHLRRRSDTGRALQLTKAFGIEDALDRRLTEYSHGMKIKIQVIAAVMHQPKLLILDEPFRGLDPDGMMLLRHLISLHVRRENAVLIATHDMLRAGRDCDTVTILSNSQTVATGSPSELVQSNPDCSGLEELFLKLTKKSDGENAVEMIDGYFGLAPVSS